MLLPGEDWNVCFIALRNWILNKIIGIGNIFIFIHRYKEKNPPKLKLQVADIM